MEEARNFSSKMTRSVRGVAQLFLITSYNTYSLNVIESMIIDLAEPKILYPLLNAIFFLVKTWHSHYPQCNLTTDCSKIWVCLEVLGLSRDEDMQEMVR